jgi:hypothetical protein
VIKVIFLLGDFYMKSKNEILKLAHVFTLVSVMVGPAAFGADKKLVPADLMPEKYDPRQCEALKIPDALKKEKGLAERIVSQCKANIKADGNVISPEVPVQSNQAARIRINAGLQQCGCKCICIKF